MKFKGINNQEQLWPIILSRFWNTCTCVGFHKLWVIELMYYCSRSKEHCVWSMCFSRPPPSIFRCDGCPSSLGHGGSWLGCQVLPIISTVFTGFAKIKLQIKTVVRLRQNCSKWSHSFRWYCILELATNSRSSRAS